MFARVDWSQIREGFKEYEAYLGGNSDAFRVFEQGSDTVRAVP